MVDSPSRRHPPDFAKNVLQTPARTREQVAWQLLYAVRELFPERLAELRAVGERAADEYIDELDENDRTNREVADRFRRGVHDWTSKNGMSCDAVNNAAAAYAVGDAPSVHRYIDADIRDPDFVDRTPSITARPYNETRQEFLTRATEYFERVVELYARKHGVKRGPVKREGTDHFRYLAAHLVGGHSFADIAREPDRFQLDAVVDQKTVAGEARKVARLIGLDLRLVPGPRPGRPIARARHRVRR